MRRRFRYLLAFKPKEGPMTVAEFDMYDEYQVFEKELDSQGLWRKLLNEKEFTSPEYKDANYIDMRG